MKADRCKVDFSGHRGRMITREELEVDLDNVLGTDYRTRYNLWMNNIRINNPRVYRFLKRFRL